ncbi:MAG: hypothetical protein WC975_07250 [Phycisphaerae bacterium]
MKLKRRIFQELARRDPWVFTTRFCYTLDSHDRKNPIKLFPNRIYLRELTELWLTNPLLVIAKSRQMMATWLFVCLYLWEAIMFPGRLIFLQSKREEDAIGNANAATGLLGRTRFILEHLPPDLQPQYKTSANKIEFPTNNSTIWAIPQGPDILRQHTASGILSDEMAFQYLAEDAYTAAIPTIENGGKFTALSTANPGFFQKLFTDQL